MSKGESFTGWTRDYIKRERDRQKIYTESKQREKKENTARNVQLKMGKERDKDEKLDGEAERKNR